MTDVLAFGAHPDDVEFGCGGVLARLAAEGRKVVIVDLTSGDKGTYGTPEERRKEGLAAAAVIGAERIFLDFRDCEVADTYEGRLQLVRVIRHYRPSLVLAPLWEGPQNHPDHTACGLLARHACRYARFKNVLPEMPPHRVDGILHYVNPFVSQVDFIVDVTSHFETWKKMLACHKSQFVKFHYDEWNTRLANRFGVMIEKEYAQGFVAGNPIVVDDIMSIKRGTREL